MTEPQAVIDPAMMLTELAGLVHGLQGEVRRLAEVQAATATAAREAPPVPTVVHTVPEPVVNREVTGKLKLPQPKTFNGSSTVGAVENFLFDCMRYFRGMHISADAQVDYAVGLLEGGAKTWWRFICMRLEGTPEEDLLQDWTYFHDELIARFRAVNATRHARDKMASLRQDGSVRIYAQKFQELSMQIPNMHDEELLDRFTRGLKPRTRMEVTMRDPRTFEEAVKLADRMDSLYTPGFGLDRQPKGRFASAANPTPIPFRPANPASDPVPMEIDALRRRLPPLTDSERDRLRKIGGCFRCRQTGHIATNCPLGTSTGRPSVNNVDHQAPPTEHPDLIDLGSEPRCSENFTPQ